MKKFLKNADYKLLMLLFVIFIGIFLSVCLPRIEYSKKIIIEVDKKKCEVSLLNDGRLIAKLKSDKSDCKIYLLNKN